MALPRRCKHCRCYTAPWLKRCPRCNKKVPFDKVAVKLTKEEKQVERDKKDIGVPVIHQSKMQWVPSRFAIESHQTLVDETKRKLERAEGARNRNALRAEIRAFKTTLARTASPKRRWTTELFRAKQATIHILISPKGKRYVPAHPDHKVDLIIKNVKKSVSPISRLQLFDKSPYHKMVKVEKREEKIHAKRTKVKKVRREQKRKHKKQSTLS